MSDFDSHFLVIGAGVVGLAVARRLAETGRPTLLVERHPRVGQEASSRNSACVHAGVYYHSGSLKGQLCNRGRALLYDFCRQTGIACRQTGKLFLYTDPALAEGMARLDAQARANGFVLQQLDRAAIGRLEPALNGWAALLCPDSGVIDTHELMLTLLALGERAGLTHAPATQVTGAEPCAGGWLVRTASATEPVKVRAVINCAGLWGLDLARTVFPNRPVPQARPLKGAYLRYRRTAPISRLVYPDLVPGVLTPRVDATVGIDGVLRFGPSSHPAHGYDDYAMPDTLVAELAPTIRRYLAVDDDDLIPDFAGIRPRIAAEDNAAPADFRFDFAPQPGWLDLWGMESPALTASLAIAEHVHALLNGRDLV